MHIAGWDRAFMLGGVSFSRQKHPYVDYSSKTWSTITPKQIPPLSSLPHIPSQTFFNFSHSFHSQEIVVVCNMGLLDLTSLSCSFCADSGYSDWNRGHVILRKKKDISGQTSFLRNIIFANRNVQFRSKIVYLRYGNSFPELVYLTRHRPRMTKTLLRLLRSRRHRGEIWAVLLLP